jgi:ABC-type lipoprotein export system ATPase subunit
VSRLELSLGTDDSVAELVLTSVGRTYRATPPVQVLHECSLSVGSGSAVSIVGRSGSGKSTLLNIMGLIDRADEGTYKITGTDVTYLKERERTALRARYFGLVYQRHHLLRDRTVAENVELPLLYRRLPLKKRRNVSADAVEMVGLAHRAGAMTATLSGGEAQRASIARALAQSPSVLLCDEPTGNLDSATANEIIGLIFALNRIGLTVVVVTHDEELAHRAPRRLEMVNGRVRDRSLARTT